MRYILNFYDRLHRKGYMDEGFQPVCNILMEVGPSICRDRDLQMYRVLIFYISLKNKEYLPDKVAPPVIYDLPHRPHNLNLAARNIFVCDDSFYGIASG